MDANRRGVLLLLIVALFITVSAIIDLPDAATPKAFLKIKGANANFCRKVCNTAAKDCNIQQNSLCYFTFLNDREIQIAENAGNATTNLTPSQKQVILTKKAICKSAADVTCNDLYVACRADC